MLLKINNKVTIKMFVKLVLLASLFTLNRYLSYFSDFTLTGINYIYTTLKRNKNMKVSLRL